VVTTPFTFMATDNEEPASGTPEPAEAVDPSPSQNIPTMQDSGMGTRPSYIGESSGVHQLVSAGLGEIVDNEEELTTRM
jgi:hypothetical protein